MDNSSGRPRRRTHPILLALVLLAALLTTLALAPAPTRNRVGATTQALTGWLWPTSWCWPLAAALTLVALSAPPARRRWPQPVRRLPAAIGLFAGLVGLASLATMHRPAVGLIVVGVVVGVGLVAALALVVPRRVVPRVPDAVLDRLPSDRDRLEVTEANAKLRNDVRTSGLQTLVGLAVLAGAVLGFQQLTEDRRQATATRELTRQGQASERFTRAIDQLASKRPEAQLGGIYGLEQIAKQAEDNRLAVTQVLVAYLHRATPKPAKPQPTSKPAKPQPASISEDLRIRAPDVHAVLIVLGRRQPNPNDPVLDLGALDLSFADLRGADLNRADLRNTSLHRAGLRGAQLRGAYLVDADLRSAGLVEVDLSGADLSVADLRQANLSDADLRCAKVRRVDMRHEELRCADLTGADLRGADLTGADLTGADLRGAVADGRTTWPAGFDWQGARIRLQPTSTRP